MCAHRLNEKKRKDKKEKGPAGIRRSVFSLCKKKITVLARLIGKSCSTLSASSLKNLSAIGSTHSFSEAMLHLTLSFLRLVCSKHSTAPPFSDSSFITTIILKK